MEAWVGVALDHLWRNALAAVPLTLLVAGVCRWLPCRPTTRHALWAMLLAWLILPPLLPDLSQPTTTQPAETTIAELSNDDISHGPTIAAGASSQTPNTETRRRSVNNTAIERVSSGSHVTGGSDSAESSLGTALNRFDQDTSAPPSVTPIRHHLYIAKSAGNEDIAEHLAKSAPDRSAPLVWLAPRADWAGPLPSVTSASPSAIPAQSLQATAPPPVSSPDPTWCGAQDADVQLWCDLEPSDQPYAESVCLLPEPQEPDALTYCPADDVPVSCDAVSCDADWYVLPIASAAPPMAPSAPQSSDSSASSVPSRTAVSNPRGDSPMPFADQLASSDGSHPDPVLTDRYGVRRAGPESIGLANTTPTATSKRSEGAGSVFTEWVTAIRNVRDAVGTVPTLPTLVWLGGLLVVLTACAVRVVAFRRSIRKASPASESICFMVRQAARRIGLQHAPRVLMVDGNLSPMIWCGRQPSLLLPKQLWSQLDRVGRNAIICHELAHLRRRDHWIRLGELVVAALYWWHPLVWWIRRRLHEEAEVCCDAWVTWLMPRDRRAYAEALLQTKKYLADQRDAMPAVGIGVTSGRAKRLARRITMVMTASARPGMSLPGVALVMSMAIVGWLVTPAQSCPSEKKAAPCALADCKTSCTHDCGETCSHSCGKACSHAKCAVKCSVKCPKTDCGKPCTSKKCVRCADGATSSVGGTSFERHVASGSSAPRASSASRATVTPRSHGSSRGFAAAAPLAFSDVRSSFALADSRDDDDRSRRTKRADSDKLDRLNNRVEALERRIDKLLDHLERDEPRAPRPPRASSAPRANRAPRPPRAPRAPRPPRAPSPVSEISTVAPLIVGAGVGTYVASYELPEGKLEALAELMVRSDVPILVRPGDDSIAVTATAAQHGAFRAFVNMISDSGEQDEESYALPEGKLEAITALMGRSDVPVLISTGDDAITVQGNATQQAVFKAFVEMINPSDDRGADARLKTHPTPATELEAYSRNLKRFNQLTQNSDREILAAAAQLKLQSSLMQIQAAEMRIQEESQRESMKEHREHERTIREQERSVREHEKSMREQERAVREHEKAVREYERARRMAEEEAQREREKSERKAQKRKTNKKRKPKKDERTEIQSNPVKQTRTSIDWATPSQMPQGATEQ